MFPCFLGRVRVALVAEHRQRADEPGARLARPDHLVDVAERRGLVRVGELLAVLGDVARRAPRPDRPPSPARRGTRCSTAPSGPITAISAVGIREVDVGADVLGRHDVVGAAVRLARDHGQLGHGRLGERVEQLGAVLDDAAALLGGAGQEAGHVDEGHERDVEAVAEADEARRLHRRVDVQAAGQVRGLVGDDARPAGRPGARSRRRCSARSSAGPRRS